MPKKEFSPAEVVEEMKEITSSEEDTELAEVLGTTKQTIYQFKKGKQQDVKMKIINYLLNERDSKKPRAAIAPNLSLSLSNIFSVVLTSELPPTYDVYPPRCSPPLRCSVTANVRRQLSALASMPALFISWRTCRFNGSAVTDTPRLLLSPW